MFWAFWYHLHNFKNVKHNHRHVLLKYYSSVSVFCIFQNCTSSTKLCKASHINLKQHFLFALSSFGFGKGTIKIGGGRGGAFYMVLLFRICSTLTCWRSIPYRNQSMDLQSKSIDWFLYHRDLHHERVN